MLREIMHPVQNWMQISQSFPLDSLKDYIELLDND
jgi:hypothetical protein